MPVVKQNHRNRLAGGDIKPSKGAVFKSYGAERLEKDYVMSIIRYG